MTQIHVKGHDINVFNIRNTHYRRAVQFQNQICSTLRKIGVSRDDIEIELQTFAGRDAEASVSFYFSESNLFISHCKQKNFAENLQVLMNIIEIEVSRLANEEITVEEFVRIFTEEKDIQKKRKEARELFGVDEDCKDMEEIHAIYKQMAKKYHPDMPTGNLEKFKKINNAHKVLKRELE